MSSMMRERRRPASGGASSNTASSPSPPAPKDESASQSESNSTWRVFSANADKAWAEKWFLAYSPVWPLLFVLWVSSPWHVGAGDSGNLAVAALIAAPNVAVPLALCPTRAPWYETYWFKFVWWVAIFSFVASYFFTEYFFDVLGMVYAFPHLRWNLDSRLVGSGKQVVPLIMYLHAWYFFITYHTVSVIFIRVIRTAPVVRDSRVAQVLAVVFSSWLFAWGEIYMTTMDTIEEHFTYRDMEWALTWGAVCYACYFVPSFPMVFFLDEDVDVDRKSSLWQTTQSALAAGMLAFLLLDVVAQYVITDWQAKAF